MHGHKKSHLQIRYFLALLWAHPILHISTIRVKPNSFCRSTVQSQAYKQSSNLKTKQQPLEKEQYALQTRNMNTWLNSTLPHFMQYSHVL